MMAIALTVIAVATTGSFLSVGARAIRDQELQIETTQALRAAVDVMIRDLRLGGACLPVNGSFISLEAGNNGTEDQITTRTGLTRQDMYCIRTATPIGTVTTATGNTIQVERTDGFAAGTRGYIRGPTNGEFFTVTSVDAQNHILGRDASLTRDYPEGSGVYAIDERKYFIGHWAAASGDIPELMMQIGDKTPQPFAVGIEALDVQYQLQRNCPPCDLVDAPNGDNEWRLVQEILLTVTARSDKQKQSGDYYRRTMSVRVKPRNLIPQ